jgi:hypothetical protein
LLVGAPRTMRVCSSSCIVPVGSSYGKTTPWSTQEECEGAQEKRKKTVAAKLVETCFKILSPVVENLKVLWTVLGTTILETLLETLYSRHYTYYEGGGLCALLQSAGHLLNLGHLLHLMAIERSGVLHRAALLPRAVPWSR